MSFVRNHIGNSKNYNAKLFTNSDFVHSGDCGRKLWIIAL